MDQPNSNLLRQVPASKITRFAKDASFYKVLGLDFLLILSAYFTGWAFEYYFLEDKGGANYFPIFMAILGVLAVFSVFEVIMIPLGRRIGIIILEIAALLLPIYLQNKNLNYFYYLVAAAILLIFILLGDLSARGFLKNYLEIKFSKVARKTLSKLATGLILIFLIFYFLLVSDARIVNSMSSLTNGAFDFSKGILTRLYPDINFSGTFGDFVKSLALYQLNADIRFQTLPPEEQKKLLDKGVQGLIAQINQQFGINIAASQSLDVVFASYISKTFEGWKVQYGFWFLLGWLVVMFFLVKSFAIIFEWLIIFLSFILFNILEAADFIRIIPKNRVQEVIEI